MADVKTVKQQRKLGSANTFAWKNDLSLYELAQELLVNHVSQFDLPTQPSGE